MRRVRQLRNRKGGVRIWRLRRCAPCYRIAPQCGKVAGPSPEGALDDIKAAYAAETRALIGARFPIAGALFLAFMAVAYMIEWIYFPARWLPLSLCYLAFAVIVTGCNRAIRWWPRAALEVTLFGSVALAFTLAAYLAMVHGSGELTLLAMIGFLTGEVVQFPWGARGQIFAALSAVLAYVWALHIGAVPALPLPYGLFALASHATMTVVGAQLLESYRFAAFREAAEAIATPPNRRAPAPPRASSSPPSRTSCARR